MSESTQLQPSLTLHMRLEPPDRDPGFRPRDAKISRRLMRLWGAPPRTNLEPGLDAPRSHLDKAVLAWASAERACEKLWGAGCDGQWFGVPRHRNFTAPSIFPSFSVRHRGASATNVRDHGGISGGLFLTSEDPRSRPQLLHHKQRVLHSLKDDVLLRLEQEQKIDWHVSSSGNLSRAHALSSIQGLSMSRGSLPCPAHTAGSGTTPKQWARTSGRT
jgi:hypothetical protein